MKQMDRIFTNLKQTSGLTIHGTIQQAGAITLKAVLPDATIGDMVHVERTTGTDLEGEIVGFEQDQAVILPFTSTEGVKNAARVTSTRAPFQVMVGKHLLGRILDGTGMPIDGKDCDLRGIPWPLHNAPPNPLKRRRIMEPLATNIRAIDGFLTLGRGQRIGLFAPAGCGKSSLLGHITRNADADVNVICLVGERGREIPEFVSDNLTDETRDRSVLVCSTSDQSPIMRRNAALVATSIAEYFRSEGLDVLLLVDSITRLARAQREIGLANGEPPTQNGYPPSTFALLPRILERAGTSERGSITGIYTVLVAGDDLNEPIADEIRSILDGHLILSSTLAYANHWPAIDVQRSISRTMNHVTSFEHQEAARGLRQLLAAYRKQETLIRLGAYEHGSDATTDLAIQMMPSLLRFLQQPLSENQSYACSIDGLLRLNAAMSH